MDTPSTVRIDGSQLVVDLEALWNEVPSDLRRASRLVAFGLGASDSVSDSQYKAFMKAVRIQTRKPERSDLTMMRQDFEEWVLEGALKTCVEAVNTLLERTRDACVILGYGGGATASQGAWNERRASDAARYHEQGLPGKLSWLERDYGPELRPALSQCVLSINQARNCFAHRRGIVGSKDLNAPGIMRVEWQALEAWARGPGGARLTQLTGPVGDTGEIEAQIVPKVKDFKLGDRVRFTPEEFNGIAGTIVWFGNDLVRGVHTFAARKGFQVQVPPA